MPLNLDLLVPGYVREFEPYIPSKPDPELMKLYGCKRLFRLNNNENPLGPPPGAQEVLKSFPPSKGAVYPSGDSYYLRREIASLHGIDPDQILVGNGANEVITFVIKAFCEKGDNIITADKTFAVYEWVATFSGIEAKVIPLRDEGFDDGAMLRAIDRDTKILFVCNPNNPTGTYWSRDRLIAVLEEVRGRQIVVVDEAYFEFVEAEDYPDGISLLKDYPNLVVFRTFSKMYGLAALRIGYLVGDLSVVDMIRRTCVVYSVNSLAQEAALAALKDESGHIGKTSTLVKESREFLRKELTGLGLPLIANEGNYLIAKLPGSDTLAYRKLMREGIMIRPMTGFRYPDHIRVTLAQREAMEAFVGALKKILKG
ncbi:histidinol phosphate aminotransferase apoenzyme [Syntrophus gentianae]|uniref:Histidinol-phosphate aminotransferase n=1 Tax=Syntrophus gentianae TaxID=43775 RepID=A0A1H7ZH48_9BACT|nr:histidinol-phosphate transaminase [Syntrophus gentianae]SEM57314.1 histidinol phosphate aminotransferase apoenzyme [Syntrophus gentianae]